jgi:hypothetical protein
VKLAKRIAVAVSALLVIYTIAGFLLLPWLIERYGPRLAQDKLGRTVSVGAVRVNPFSLTLEARRFALEGEHRTPVVAFDRLAVDLSIQSLFSRAWTFDEIRLEGWQVDAAIERDGSLNLVDLARRWRGTSPSDGGTVPVVVNRLAVSGGTLHVSDLSGEKPASLAVAPIDFEASNLSTLAAPGGSYTISATLPQGGSVDSRGTLSLQPFALNGEVRGNNLKAAIFQPFLRDRLRFSEFAGVANISTRFTLSSQKSALERLTFDLSDVLLKGPGDEEPSLTFKHATGEDGRVDLAQRTIVLPKLELHDATVATAKNALLSITSAEIENGEVNIVQSRVAAQQIRVEGGRTGLVRGKDGRIELAALFANASGATSAAAKSSPSWRYDIGSAQINAFDIALADREFARPLAYEVRVQSATLRHIADDTGPLTFDVSLGVREGGKLSAQGTYAIARGEARAKVQIDHFALAPMQPLLARYAALDIKSGALSGSVNVRYAGGNPDLDIGGAVSVANLLVNESATGDRFLSWKSASADELALKLGAARELSVKEIDVLEPGAKIEISKDRQVNIARVLKPGDVANPAASARDASSNASKDSVFRMQVGRVLLRRGDVDYSDASLVLPFSTKVTAVSGTIDGLSNHPSRRAAVNARGTVPPYGAATVQGTLLPLDPAQFSDLHVAFQNVLMPPLSPYTATFAGRTIDSGRLWLDLEYKMDDGRLIGKNDVRLADFTLGERVKAPDALDLPLDLALALLKDSKGEVHLSVPVEGNLDNPQFRIGAAIGAAIGDALKRIATAPFRALASLFGGKDAEALASIDFRPGTAALQPEEREKLDTLVRALKERPQLQLVVAAPYDRDADSAALRSEQVRRDVAAQLGLKAGPGPSAGPIAYDDPATQQALEKLLASRSGADAVHATKRDSGSTEADRQKPYEAMFQRLVELYPLPDAAAQTLATGRAQAIEDYLVQRGGIDAGRVQIGRVETVRVAHDHEISAQLHVAAAPVR